MGQYDYIARNETLRPGDIVAVEVDLHQANDKMAELAASDIKAALWAEPMLDYQSGKIIRVGNIQTREDTHLLIVRVSVRDQPKADRNENPTGIVTATLASIEAICWNGLAAWAGYVYIANAYVVERREEIQEAIAEGLKEGVKAAVGSPLGITATTIVVGLAILWIIVNSKPQRE